MEKIADNLAFHASALALRSQRNTILASNIANAATPHYKARDIDFNEEMSKLERSGPLSITDDQHLPTYRPLNPNGVHYRVPLNPSLDGNTVELNVEQMQFSENAMRYQTTLSFLNGRIAGLISAIRGE